MFKAVWGSKFGGWLARGSSALTLREGTQAGAAGLKITTQLKLNALFAGVTLLGRSTPEEKVHALGQQALTFLLTAGMQSPVRQAFWQIGLALAPNMPDIGRGIVHGYRSVLESRTMAAVPFSYSTLAMDQANASLQYSMNRMRGSYSGLGTEAAFMSARYMQRG